MEGLGLKYVFGRPLKGWLRQHMGMMRGYQRRFFMLDSGRLSCLTREDDVIAIKTYVLKDCELKDYPKSTDSSFELISGKENGESVTLKAANEEEKKEWVKALRYNIYGDTGGGVFGIPLEELMKYESKEGRSIPYIVEACVKHLELNGKEIEGIFRLPGRTGLVKELRAKFEAGYRPVMDDVDVHTIGSLFKSFLRDLPESLIPPSFYQRAMNCALRYSEAKSSELQTKELTGLSELLKGLPSASYATLAYICRFLHDLTASSEKTKMDSHNLSLMFGPNLIRHMDDNPELMMVTTDLTQQLAYMLIHHCEVIFTPLPSQEASQTEAAGNSPVMTRNEACEDNIPTADLLHMSVPPNTTKPVFRSSALSDLMGVDFSQQQDEEFADQSSSRSTSPFVVITGQSEATSLGASDKKNQSPASETSGGVGCVDVSSASSSGVGSKPIPPKRKSKIFKKSQQLSTPADSSPLKPDMSSYLIIQSTGVTSDTSSTAQQLQEKDKANESDTGMYAAGDGIDKQTQEGQHLNTGCLTVVNRDKNEVANDDNCVFEAGGCAGDLARNAAAAGLVTVGVDSVTHGPSRTVLEAEVSALKTELVCVKSQYDYQVSSLKCQLNDVRSNFEDRITQMEKQHAMQVKDLTDRLAVERKARSEAVDQTVDLQAELYKYKLQYGELQDVK